MLATMKSRGPDAEGVWLGQNIALGHVRLKILDLSDKANQPFTDGTDVLVFNGEIFNYRELRDELKGFFQFETHSDTEVLFRCLQQWGSDVVNRLQGQFTFAFYRDSERSLTLARDHIGITPLYIRETADGLFAFASEIKPLLELGRTKIDTQAMIDYLYYRYNINNRRTLFSDIHRFPPATIMRIDLDSGKKQSYQYWRLNFTDLQVDDYHQSFGDVFEKEITQQIAADVPVGMVLSAGIDSSALLEGFLKKSNDIESFTISFSDNDDDTLNALEQRRQGRAKGQIVRFAESHYENLEQALFMLEEPFGDLIICANYLLAQMASDRVKVVLSGEGADEAFFGYDHQRAFQKIIGGGFKSFFMRLGVQLAPVWALDKLAPYPGKFGDQEKARLVRMMKKKDRPVDSFLEMISLFETERLRSLIKDGIPDTAPIRTIFESESFMWRALIRSEIEQLTMTVNLLKQDRFCMGFSLEGRVPYVSRNMLEFAASLPMKLQTSREVKPLLQTYGKMTRKKQAFSLLSSASYLNTLTNMMDTYVTREAIEGLKPIRWEGVMQVRQELANGGVLAVKRAMTLTVLAAWWKTFHQYLH